jgi:hypothetical protein
MLQRFNRIFLEFPGFFALSGTTMSSRTVTHLHTSVDIRRMIDKNKKLIVYLDRNLM